MNKPVVGIIISVYFLSVLAYSAAAANLDKSILDCSTNYGIGTQCNDQCDSMWYKGVIGGSGPAGSIGNEAGLFDCTVTATVCCFGFKWGDPVETNEIMTVSLTGAGSWYTEDKACNTVVSGDDDDDDNGGGPGPAPHACSNIRASASGEEPNPTIGPNGCCDDTSFTLQANENIKIITEGIDLFPHTCNGWVYVKKGTREPRCWDETEWVFSGPNDPPDDQGIFYWKKCSQISGGEVTINGQGPGVYTFGTWYDKCNSGMSVVRVCPTSSGGGICNSNNVCDTGETHASCPNDCECDSNSDCSGSTPICDTSTHTCVADNPCASCDGLGCSGCSGICCGSSCNVGGDCCDDTDCEGDDYCCYDDGPNRCHECCEDSDCDDFEECDNGRCEPTGHSFLAGTKIFMADGSLKDIKDIEIGNVILSFENDELITGAVDKTFSSVEYDYIFLKTEKHRAKVTGAHEFYVGDGRFEMIKDITIGSMVYVLDEGELVPEMIISKELVEEEVDVYDFSVIGSYTYIANGFAVHNAERAGGSETENVHFGFGLYLNLVNVFDPGEKSPGTEGETLSLQGGGTACHDCGTYTFEFETGRVNLQANAQLSATAQGQDLGIRELSISCKHYQPPNASAGPDQTHNLTGATKTVTLNGGNSEDPDGSITSYRWDFGDGQRGSGRTTTHAYGEGRYTITLTVTDNDGLTDDDTMAVATNDFPTITDDYANDGIWVNSNQDIELTAEDPSSKLKNIRYCEGSACNPGVSGNSIPNTGSTKTFSYKISKNSDYNNIIKYKAWDTYNNPANGGQVDVKIDKTAPSTTDNADSQTHGNGYSVTLTCSDGGSGCDTTHYCVSANGTSSCTPSGIVNTVIVTCPAFSYCEKKINYYSIDNVDNQESTVRSETIKIDTRIPTCNMTSIDPYMTSEDIALEWSGDDPTGEGVTGYRVWSKKDSESWAVEWDESTPSFTSGTFTGEDGSSYEFRCQAKSNSFLTGGSYSTTVSTFVDTTPPSVSIDPISGWTGGDSFAVTWSGTDSGSGVKEYDTEYSTSPPSWSTWLTGTESGSGDFGGGDPVTLIDGTTYHIRVKSRDNAGLESDWSDSVSTGIDLTPPTCSITGLPDYIITSEFPVTLSGSDSGSGVKNYDADQSLDGENWEFLVSHTVQTTFTANLADGRYYIRCRARDNADNEGDWSSPETVTVDTRAPNPSPGYATPTLGGKNMTITATIKDFSDITDVILKYGDVQITASEMIQTDDNEWNVSWVFPVDYVFGSDEFIIVTEDMHGNARDFRYSFNVILCNDDETRICGTNVGECMKGEQTCVEGTWAACLGGLSPRLELCDDLDNDCDGVTDNGIECLCVPGTTRDCGTSTGECNQGTQTCGEDQAWQECTGNHVRPEKEICDGLDNDCDGEKDNGAQCCQDGNRRPCGFSNEGICEFGASLCRDGIWQECAGAIMPEDYDICDNGIDDNCDGEIDDGCVKCSNQVQDEGEDGVDCGGPCSPCADYFGLILIIIGILLLAGLVIGYIYFKKKGEELSWENLKKEWGDKK